MPVQADDNGYAMERRRMVEGQIIARGVRDSRVLEAMLAVPRHLFVPEELQPHAYEDRPLSIGHEQTISQPYIVAYMTEALGVQESDRVLEVGLGSGYQAAVLAKIAMEVYTLEVVESLIADTRQRLAVLGYRNILIKHGDGYEGWKDRAPFDAVIVTAAPPEIPEKLLEQLKVGGRMVIPVGGFDQELYLVTKTLFGLERKNLGPVRFVPMVRSNR